MPSSLGNPWPSFQGGYEGPDSPVSWLSYITSLSRAPRSPSSRGIRPARSWSGRSASEGEQECSGHYVEPLGAASKQQRHVCLKNELFGFVFKSRAHYSYAKRGMRIPCTNFMSRIIGALSTASHIVGQPSLSQFIPRTACSRPLLPSITLQLRALQVN